MLRDIIDFLQVADHSGAAYPAAEHAAFRLAGVLRHFSAIVFAETGLLVGFFVPGDSLLFTVGVVVGAGH